ncbi:hypothetical protein Hdeb2414_s0025g00666421 [Helianthus debilis subsp. tardiflorus]
MPRLLDRFARPSVQDIRDKISGAVEAFSRRNLLGVPDKVRETRFLIMYHHQKMW